MALIQCPHCGNQISSSAEKCPHCGYTLTAGLSEPESSKNVSLKHPTQSIHVMSTCKSIIFSKKFIIPAVVIVLIMLIYFFTNRLSPDEKYQVQIITEQINSIGQVELYSGEKILSIEAQYDKLSPKCKRHVKNRKNLRESKNKWNELQAENVSKQIDDIGDVQIGTEIKLQFAETAYKKLTDEQKKLVKNYNKLEESREKLSNLKIQSVEDLINSIGTISSIDSETKSKISAAEQAYNGTLSDDEKAKVNNYSVLQIAHNQFANSAIENCIRTIDQIGDVTLESSDKIHAATEAYLLVFSEDKDKVTNHLKLDEATKTLISLQDAEAERQKSLHSGDTFTTQNWEITFKKARVSAKILPNNTNGYYLYYYADDDSVYVDLVFNVKNVSSDRLSLDRIISNAKVEYGGKYNYTVYNVFHSSGSDIDAVYSWDGIDALHSTTLHVAIKLPRVAQSSSESIKATLTIAGEEKIINVR